MGNFLTVILQCTISMSLITLAYAAIAPLLSKRYTARWQYMAWLAIALGWAFPFRPQVELSFLSPQMTNISETSVWPIANAILPMVDTGDIASASAGIPVWSILATMWISGIMSLAVYHALRHGRFMKMVRRWSEPVTETESLMLLDALKSEMGIKTRIKLDVCQSVTSPMLVGFFRPVILLPTIKIASDELCLILKHELVHFQRHDLWSKALILAATILHWFNPVVYLMAKAATTQCEISCDALTLQDADFHKRKQYGEAIIGTVRNGARLRTTLSTYFYGGKGGMKKRIFAIMDTKRKKAGIAIFCMTLASIITIGTAVAAAAIDADSAAAEDNSMGAAVLYYRDNGQEQVSIDGGQTWMDVEAYHELYPDLLSSLDWWSYDEYEAYVEEQKKVLSNLIGESYDYYDKQGVLHKDVWTQEKVDEAIRLHEQTLEYIKNGWLVSKSLNEEYVDKDGEVSLATSTGISMMDSGSSSSSSYGASLVLDSGETKDLGLYATKEEAFAAAKAFCDEQVKIGTMTQQEADEILNQYK
jgi:beta-lactamase regulating signal transducer with metallopeptidase domain